METGSPGGKGGSPAGRSSVLGTGAEMLMAPDGKMWEEGGSSD